jgi:hypothetical protein
MVEHPVPEHHDGRESCRFESCRELLAKRKLMSGQSLYGIPVIVDRNLCRTYFAALAPCFVVALLLLLAIFLVYVPMTIAAWLVFGSI